MGIILYVKGRKRIRLLPILTNVTKRHRQSNSGAGVSETSADQDYERVFASHEVALRHFLLGVLKDVGLVQDALQSTFIKLLQKGDTVENRAAIKGWLFRVAYNEAMLVRRKQTTASKHLETFAWQIDWSNRQTNEPDAHMIEEETRAQVAQALKRLSIDQFNVVEKRIYQGLKFREIADELNLPLGTVLARMHSSLKKLKTVLENFQINDND